MIERKAVRLTVLLAVLALRFSPVNAAAYLVTVRTAPPGAFVIVDGREPALLSPVQFDAVAAKIALLVRKPGYRDYRADLQLIPGRNEVFVRLTTASSRFSFIKSFRTGNRPKDLIFSPDGRYLLISLLGDRGIQFYEPATGALKKLDLSGYSKTPCFVEGVFSPDGREFWFNQMSQSGLVYVLDLARLAVKKVIPTFGNWSKVGEFSPDGRFYYVTNWLSNDISVIDAASYSFRRKVTTPGKAPRGLGFSADGQYLYVVFYDSGEIMKLAVEEDYKLVARVRTGGTNGRFRIDRAREIAYVNNMRLGRVFIYSLKEDKVVGEFRTWINPNNVQIGPGGRFIFVSNRGPNSAKGYLYPSPVDGRIQVFDAEDGYRLTEELQVGNQPIGIAFTPDGGIVAISNYMDNTVEMYRIDTPALFPAFAGKNNGSRCACP